MRPLEKFYDAYGRLLARHPFPFLIIPVIITVVSSYGIQYFHSQDDIWDIYSPLNALSRTEEKALEKFEYASSANHYRIQILVDRKDGGSLMNTQDLLDIGSLHKLITDNVTASDGMKTYWYREMCGVYCNESNSIIVGFLQAVVESGGESANLMLTYPNAQALQNQIFVGYSIGNLHYSTKNPELVDGFKLLVLHYMVDLRLPMGRTLSRDFETKLRNLFGRATQESATLNYALLSRNRELEEQREITVVAVPYLGVTGLVLTGFMLITLVNVPLYTSQHVEAIFGVISPGMALWTSGGMLWWFGYPFSNILTVVPFLVITIGIDDAFLILAGWRHSSEEKDFEKRMGLSLAKSGASVTVTSITDVLCFAVGLVSNLPVVRLFCLYTSIALAIDFIYQVTFFSAIVVYCGKRQMAIGSEKSYQSRNASLKRTEPSLTEMDIFTKIKGKMLTIANTAEFPSDGKQKERRGALLLFVDWLHAAPVRILILTLFIIHICASTYLCTKVNTDFDMENLYLKRSPLTEISRKMQKFVLEESFVVNFALDSMPSFEDPAVRERFAMMIHDLENIPIYGMGDKGTTLWTKEYELAISFWGEDDSLWKPDELLKNYKEYGLDRKFLTTRMDEQQNEVIDGFFWWITYHNMQSFLDVQKMMDKRRAILAKHAHEFNVSSHHPLEKVPTESAASAPENFVQTAVSAIILMSFLVFLFVLDLNAIISVVMSIISICSGTVGYLHLWGVHLDAVSLISMLMSIGFSVDYSAHICYHFFTHVKDAEEDNMGTDVEQTQTQKRPKKDRSSRARLEDTFKGVGWPVIQSGLSTVLGMIPLVLVQAYVVAVFWKTIILVTLLGMFHALFLLPVLFLCIEDVYHYIKSLYPKSR
ncbi:hypothetical protein QR680_000996 [Steinernema hermaphroditum]|uniref:SSD domain-containing protein n=1 Tax=Steinernema hermaphroditum TaxID=289476 RepID=A0AA39LF58_9BILA|nr:hypothetical protein QR680_000996 [Steinernema hermaphroditum]